MLVSVVKSKKMVRILLFIYSQFIHEVFKYGAEATHTIFQLSEKIYNFFSKTINC